MLQKSGAFIACIHVSPVPKSVEFVRFEIVVRRVASNLLLRHTEKCLADSVVPLSTRISARLNRVGNTFAQLCGFDVSITTFD